MNSDGQTLWSYTYGGDYGKFLQETTDNGFIVTGAYQGHCYLLKTDSLGVSDHMSLSIESWIEEASFSLSPNPTSSSFKITTSQIIINGTLQIFNTLGEKVFEQKDLQGFQNLVSLPANISSGIYFVKLIDGEKQFTLKLIIQ